MQQLSLLPVSGAPNSELIETGAATVKAQNGSSEAFGKVFNKAQTKVEKSEPLGAHSGDQTVLSNSISHSASPQAHDESGNLLPPKDGELPQADQPEWNGLTNSASTDEFDSTAAFVSGQVNSGINSSVLSSQLGQNVTITPDTELQTVKGVVFSAVNQVGKNGSASSLANTASDLRSEFGQSTSSEQASVNNSNGQALTPHGQSAIAGSSAPLVGVDGAASSDSQTNLGNSFQRSAIVSNEGLSLGKDGVAASAAVSSSQNGQMNFAHPIFSGELTVSINGKPVDSSALNPIAKSPQSLGNGFEVSAKDGQVNSAVGETVLNSRTSVIRTDTSPNAADGASDVVGAMKVGNTMMAQVSAAGPALSNAASSMRVEGLAQAQVQAAASQNANTSAGLTSNSPYNANAANITSTSLQPESSALVSESDFRAKLQFELSSRGIQNVDDAPDLGLSKFEGLTNQRLVSDSRVPESQAGKAYVSSLPLAVDDPDWSNQLNQKLMWMSARNIQQAELHLNPADMGPIDIKIQIGAEQSSININAQNQGVRELLEANIHKLKEMLNGSSEELADAGEQSLGQSSGQESSPEQGGQEDQSVAYSAGTSTPQNHQSVVSDNPNQNVSLSDSLVDAYA